MKAWKKFTGIVLTVCIMFAMLLVPDMEPAAKATVSSKNVTVIVGSTYNNPVRVNYSKEGHTIKNIKSNSSNLLVRQTYQWWSSQNSGSYANIEMYAKKAGKYKVTFNVCNDKNKVVSTHTINVTATTPVASAKNSPIKSATFAGKPAYSYSGDIVSKKSGKFKVTMNKGFKLKSITMRTCNAKGEEVQKKVKNNTNIKLGEYANKSESGYSYENNWSYYYYSSMMAMTYIEVQYQNTKTKTTGTITYSFYKIPKN